MHEFVCNKRVNNGSSPLFKGYKFGFSDRMKKALLEDDDPILVFFDGLDNFTRECSMDTGVLFDYRNLIYTKHIAKDNLLPRSQIYDSFGLFALVQERVIDVVKNATWIPTEVRNELVNEIKDVYLLPGITDDMDCLECIKMYLTIMKKRFFDLVAKENKTKNIDHYSKLLKEAYDAVLRSTDLGTGEDHLAIELYSSTKNITLDISGWHTVYNYSHPHNTCKNWREFMLAAESHRLVTQMLLDQNSPVTRRVDVGSTQYNFAEAQDFLVGFELQYCDDDGFGRKNLYEGVEVFQKAFRCESTQTNENCGVFQ
ncbi:hypothetical protein QR680_014533 [Steinernema hermaphroditum]|uniref:Uncharacterized protein n=1 Tax=Steinernema hermaphroditum TaxID=289476 RepID=A0AA39IBD1_9BILA|nr:hypothetical protein QR680_014533 [Steinernema hermaphroditum]